MRANRQLFGGVLATACVGLVSLVNPAYADGDQCHRPSVYVKPGESIQAAITAAKPGARIIVEAGTYAEQLTIETDGISLVGQGAILVPPTTPTENLCSGLAGNGTEAGICIAGQGVKLEPYTTEHRKVSSVDRPVMGVSVTGFQVQNFTGQNIAVVGGQDTQIYNNWLYDGGWYGFLADGSRNTRVADNTIATTGALYFIALCTDDMATALVSNNHITGYYIGLCCQTPHSEIVGNDVSMCCTDAFIDPNVDGVHLHHNHFSNTDPRCVGAWPFIGGIYVDGAINSKVEYNLVEGQHAGGLAPGVVVVDDPTVTPLAVAMGNVVQYNIFKNNDFDVYVNTTGTGNVVTPNSCTTPAELCTA